MAKIIIKKLLHPEVIIMLGAFIIFCSWVIQNFVEKKYQMQRQEIERVEKIINEYETYSGYYSSNSQNPDSVVHLLFQKNYLTLSMNLFDIVANALNDESVWKIASGRPSISIIEKLYHAKEYSKIDSICETVKGIRETIQADVLIKFYDKYDKICAKEDKASWVFVIVYGLGAIISGIGVFLKKRPEIIKVSPGKETGQ